MSNLATIDDVLFDEDTSEKDDAKRATVAVMKFINNIGKAERLGLPAMVEAIHNMAKHKNSTPAVALMNMFIGRGLGEERIFAYVIRAYFGDKVVTGKKDTDHGFKFNLDNFPRGVAPRNRWARIVAERTDEKGAATYVHTYNSPAFKKLLKEMFAVDKPEPADIELQAKALAAVTAATKKGAACGVTLDALLTAIRTTYANVA